MRRCEVLVCVRCGVMRPAMREGYAWSIYATRPDEAGATWEAPFERAPWKWIVETADLLARGRVDPQWMFWEPVT